MCRKAVDEKWAMWSLKDGLGSLTSALHDNLLKQGVDVRTNCGCTGIERNGDGLLVSINMPSFSTRIL